MVRLYHGEQFPSLASIFRAEDPNLPEMALPWLSGHGEEGRAVLEEHHRAVELLAQKRGRRKASRPFLPGPPAVKRADDKRVSPQSRLAHWVQFTGVDEERTENCSVAQFQEGGMAIISRRVDERLRLAPSLYPDPSTGRSWPARQSEHRDQPACRNRGTLPER